MPTLTGTDGADTLTGGTEADSLIGGLGQDTLTGGGGADRFVFGAWDQSPAPTPDVILDFQTGLDRIDLSAVTGIGLVWIMSIGSNAVVLAATSRGLMRIDTFGTVAASDIVGGGTVQTIAVTGFGSNASGAGSITSTVGLDVRSTFYYGGAGADTMRGVHNGQVGLFNTEVVDILFGGAGDDTITAGTGDWAFGGDGDDTLTMGWTRSGLASLPPGGQAVLVGGRGSDRFVFQPELRARVTDFTTGGPEADRFIVPGPNTVFDQSAEGVVVRGNIYTWLIEGVTLADFATRVFDAAGNLYPIDLTPWVNVTGIVQGAPSGRILSGESGADTLDYAMSTSGLNITTASTGVTVITSATDSDTARRFEVLIGSGLADRFTGIGSFSELRMGAGNDVVTLNASSSATLRGEAGDDTLTAGSGDNIVEGGAGADAMDGGAGTDTLTYAASAGGVLVNLGNGSASGFDATGDSFVRFENLTGSGFDDVLTGDAGSNTLVGGTGADRLFGGDGFDTLDGGMGGDVLTGGAGSDFFTFTLAPVSPSTPSAYDLITDFATGTDRIHIDNLQPSTVSIIYTAGGSFIFADTPGGLFQLAVLGDRVSGRDVVYNSSVGLFMVGTDTADSMSGSFRRDSLVGGGGNDDLTGGGGADSISGGAGADIFRYLFTSDSYQPTGATQQEFDNLYDFQTGVDRIDIGALNATSVSLVRADNGSTVVFAETSTGIFLTSAANLAINGADIDYGGTFGIYMIGSATDDTLIGTSRNDPLEGRDGNDTLIGGVGADGLTGGAGADVFKYVSVADSGLAAGTADIVRDMVSGVDKIDLTAVRTGTRDSFGIAYFNNASFLFVDLGGDGVNEMLIQFTNVRLATDDILWSLASLGAEPVIKTVGPEILPAFDDVVAEQAMFATGKSMLDLDFGVGSDLRHSQDWFL